MTAAKRGGWGWMEGRDGCLCLNSLKDIKALEARFSTFQTWSLPLTLEALNRSEAGRPGVSWPFDSHGRGRSTRGWEEAGFSCSSAANEAPDRGFHRQQRTDVARKQILKPTLVAAAFPLR